MSAPVPTDQAAGSVPDGRWLIYACRTPYAAEAAEAIWRGGGTVAALVDNYPSGDIPSGLGPAAVHDAVGCGSAISAGI